MTLETTYIKEVEAFIEKTKKLLKDEDYEEYYTKALGAIESAIDILDDNENKLAILEDAVTKWAQQLVIDLFEEQSLTDEAEAEYRSFKGVKDTTARVKEFDSEMQKEIDALNEEQGKIIARQKELDIFKAVVRGMSVEEAKAKLEAYEQQLSQAQGR